MCLQHAHSTATAPHFRAPEDENAYLSFAACINMASMSCRQEREGNANVYLGQAMNISNSVKDRQSKMMMLEIVRAKQAHYAKQYEQARKLFISALNMFPLCKRNEDLVLCDLISSLAETEFITGNYFAARHHLLQAVAIDKRILGELSAEYKAHLSQLHAVEYAQNLRFPSNAGVRSIEKTA